MGAGGGSSRTPGGTVGDRYDLLDRLGTGGMGTVWRAHDRVLDRLVAVKLFDRAAAGTDPADQSRATREARVLAQLNHPHLVAVLDAGGASPDRLDHLVMELVGGPTLRDRLRRGALTPDAVLRLGAELASALAYVHDRGVVHRDLKPANILFTSDDDAAQAKLADFGIARLLSAAPLTSTGMLVGTATYLSPEQALGRRVGTESDVYSLGLVLLECLTGAPAYEGQGVEAVSARLHRDPDPTGVADPRTRALLTAMTAREPGDRPDARTTAEAFEALAAGEVERFDRLGIAAPLRGPAANADGAAPTRVETASTEALAATAVRTVRAPGAAAPRAPLAPGVGAGSVRGSGRGRVVPVAVGSALLLGLVLALGAGLLGSSDRQPSSDPSSPSGPTAVVTGTGPSASPEPTAATSSTTRAPSSASSRSGGPGPTQPGGRPGGGTKETKPPKETKGPKEPKQPKDPKDSKGPGAQP